MDTTQCIWCEEMERKWKQFKLPEELASNPILQEYLKKIKEKNHEDHVTFKECEEELIAQHNARRARATSLPSRIDIISGAPDIHIGAPEDN